MVANQIKRLVKHSGVYGVGLLVQGVLGILLLPLYTHYLTSADYGAIETLIAASAVVAIVLRAGVASAFTRFYFNSSDSTYRLTVIRTSFWFTMVSGTIGLALGLALAEPISIALLGNDDRADLVRAAAVLVWANVNYEQMTALFRVEERSVQFVIASVANLFVTAGATVLLIVVWGQGALGVLVGSFVGTLAVYLVLLGSRREQLGFGFDRSLLRSMQRFGMPLVPSLLALWAINFIDRFFLVKLAGEAETGVYSLGARISSVALFLLVAFRTAWWPFAFSIEDDSEARRTYSYVLTYLLFAMCWISVALALLAPWIVRIVAPSNSSFWPASDVVGLLAFGIAAFAAYTVVLIGPGRTGRTQLNWVITGIAALLNIVLNIALIPYYGMIGAAIATVATYVAMFVGMAYFSQSIYPVSYQWRRVGLIVISAVGLVVAGKLLHASFPVALALIALFPLALGLLGFYLPAERAHLRSFIFARRS